MTAEAFFAPKYMRVTKILARTFRPLMLYKSRNDKFFTSSPVEKKYIRSRYTERGSSETRHYNFHHFTRSNTRRENFNSDNKTRTVKMRFKGAQEIA